MKHAIYFNPIDESDIPFNQSEIFCNSEAPLDTYEVKARDS